MTIEAENRLIQARVKMLFQHPFFGQLAIRLKLEEADDWCPTAATDGRKFYYNSDFIMKLDDEEVVFLVGHELGHVMFEHFLRVEDRIKQIWNMAGDYVINYILKREKIGRVITTVSILLDEKYADWISEDVYDDLIASGVTPQQTLDMHLDMSDDDGDGSGNGKGDKEGNEDGRIGKPSPLTPEERKALQDEIKEAMINAAQAAGAGNVPAEFKRMINQLTEPKLNWREHICADIQTSVKHDFTFMRPNRKSFGSSVILPGMDNDHEIDIALAIDTSGSISDSMLTDFVSEVAGIMEQFESYRIRIWQFDTAVYGYDEFTHDDGRDIREYKITGGGGTDFMVNWAHMVENDIMPNKFIMFTDGYPWDEWGDPDYCDTLFLVHDEYGRGTVPEAPFGTTIKYEAK